MLPEPQTQADGCLSKSHTQQGVMSLTRGRGYLLHATCDMLSPTRCPVKHVSICQMLLVHELGLGICAALRSGACDRTKHSRRRDQPQGAPATSDSAGATDAFMDADSTEEAAAAPGASACKAAKLDSGEDSASGAVAELKQGRDQNDGMAQDGGAADAAAEADEHEQQQPAYAPGDCIVQVRT